MTDLTNHPSNPVRVQIGTPGEIGGRAYLLRPPGVVDRARYRRAVAEAGARRHGQLALLDGLAAAVERCMAQSEPEIRQAVVDKVKAYRGHLAEHLKTLVEGGYDGDEGRARFVQRTVELAGEAASLSAIESDVRLADRRFATMAAEESTYFGTAGVVAAQMFLVGWEGNAYTVPIARDAAGVPESQLAKIPEEDFPVIALKAESLMRVSEAQAKNSDSQPPGSSGATSMSS